MLCCKKKHTRGGLWEDSWGQLIDACFVGSWDKWGPLCGCLAESILQVYTSRRLEFTRVWRFISHPPQSSTWFMLCSWFQNLWRNPMHLRYRAKPEMSLDSQNSSAELQIHWATLTIDRTLMNFNHWTWLANLTINSEWRYRPVNLIHEQKHHIYLHLLFWTKVRTFIDCSHVQNMVLQYHTLDQYLFSPVLCRAALILRIYDF